MLLSYSTYAAVLRLAGVCVRVALRKAGAMIVVQASKGCWAKGKSWPQYLPEQPCLNDGFQVDL